MGGPDRPPRPRSPHVRPPPPAPRRSTPHAVHRRGPRARGGGLGRALVGAGPNATCWTITRRCARRPTPRRSSATSTTTCRAGRAGCSWTCSRSGPRRPPQPDSDNMAGMVESLGQLKTTLAEFDTSALNDSRRRPCEDLRATPASYEDQTDQMIALVGSDSATARRAHAWSILLQGPLSDTWATMLDHTQALADSLSARSNEAAADMRAASDTARPADRHGGARRAAARGAGRCRHHAVGDAPARLVRGRSCGASRAAT